MAFFSVSKRPYVLIAILVLAVVAVLAVYYFFDPSAEGLFPRCRFLELTGYKCPGCGTQRMLHSLLHFDLVSAFRYNAYLLTLFPLMLLLLAWDGWTRWLPKRWADAAFVTLAVLFVVLTLLWWLLRNVFGW